MPPLLLALVVCGACLGLAALFEGWTGGGARITWEVWRGEEWVPVQWTHERSAELKSGRRALARIAQGWDFDTLGVPETMPRFRATVRTRLTLPSPQHLVARPRGGQVVFLSVDGAPVGARARSRGPELEAGTPQVTFRFEGNLAVEPLSVSLELCAPNASTGCQTLKASDFALPRGKDPTRRRWHWGLALLGALLLASLAGHAARRPSPRRRRALEATALAILVAAGVGLRAVDYDVVPDLRENGDELFATWNGWSLLATGETRGWSLWPGAYGTRVDVEKIGYFGQEWYVIQPYFEHPPLLHLLAGAAAHAGGATHWSHAKLRHTRLVPLALQALTLLLIFGLGRRLDPEGPAPFLATFLYAFLPVVALQGRAIKEEALLVPLVLGTLIAWTGAERRRGAGFWLRLALAAALAGLCTLTKVTGIAMVLALGLLAWRARGVRAATVALGVGFAVSGLLLLYGALIDWDAFVFATGQQGVRGMHFNVFTRFFGDALVNMNLIGRGWVVFLWVAFAASHARAAPGARLVLAAPLVAYLVGIAIGSGDWTYGWYAMPLHALLAIGAGRFLAELWRRPTLLGGALVALLLVFYTLNFVVDPAPLERPSSWVETRFATLLLIATLLAPFAAAEIWPRRARSLGRLGLAAALALFAGLATATVVDYEQGYDRHADFDRRRFFNPTPTRDRVGRGARQVDPPRAAPPPSDAPPAVDTLREDAARDRGGP